MMRPMSPLRGMRFFMSSYLREYTDNNHSDNHE